MPRRSYLARRKTVRNASPELAVGAGRRTSDNRRSLDVHPPAAAGHCAVTLSRSRSSKSLRTLPSSDVASSETGHKTASDYFSMSPRRQPAEDVGRTFRGSQRHRLRAPTGESWVRKKKLPLGVDPSLSQATCVTTSSKEHSSLRVGPFMNPTLPLIIPVCLPVSMGRSGRVESGVNLARTGKRASSPWAAADVDS